MSEFDPHTHSIASGHATSCTITDMAKKAVSLGLKMIGITDHGPAPPHIPAGRLISGISRSLPGNASVSRL